MADAPRKSWSDRGSRHARGYGAIWVRLRARILDRDGYLCQPCRAKGRATPATEVHHVIAKARGGTDDPDNLVSICAPCHLDASAADRGHRRKRRIGPDGWPLD